jgi:putative acetyltransferase
MSLMVIRKSTLGEQQQIASFIQDTIRIINLSDYSEEHVLIWSNAITLEMLQERFDAIIQYVAEVDGEIVGVGDIRIDKEEVDFLYIHKDYIGKGVGTALLKELEDFAKKSGLKTLCVTSSITAKPFFERRGFVVSKKHVKTMGGKDFLVFLMLKEF